MDYSESDQSDSRLSNGGLIAWANNWHHQSDSNHLHWGNNILDVDMSGGETFIVVNDKKTQPMFVVVEKCHQRLKDQQIRQARSRSVKPSAATKSKLLDEYKMKNK